MLWIGTGVARYLLGLEKGSAYYNANYFFHAKMILFLLVFVLELWPMTKLMRWRAAIRRGGSATVVVIPGSARIIATISHVQALLIVLMVVAAVAMARGFNL